MPPLPVQTGASGVREALGVRGHNKESKTRLLKLRKNSVRSITPLTAILDIAPFTRISGAGFAAVSVTVCSRVHEPLLGKPRCLGGASSGEQDGRPAWGPRRRLPAAAPGGGWSPGRRLACHASLRVTCLRRSGGALTGMKAESFACPGPSESPWERGAGPLRREASGSGLRVSVLRCQAQPGSCIGDGHARPFPAGQLPREGLAPPGPPGWYRTCLPRA
ncbi:unnamed protein product [Rangifer tarandus platyrhynchus]|uniref:Uncharacterized protein n=2 Tax=Rangifer tarandus platyrhynchus TaxID=3082113 RepID=A0ACB0F058_RANTA|nr:unnamed protein product [Rangifer tarandus platyrhynchus]CAI9706032.1 unnamed protein product [Rangifer tarandus platyrhynchus]